MHIQNCVYFKTYIAIFHVKTSYFLLLPFPGKYDTIYEDLCYTRELESNKTYTYLKLNIVPSQSPLVMRTQNLVSHLMINFGLHIKNIFSSSFFKSSFTEHLLCAEHGDKRFLKIHPIEANQDGMCSTSSPPQTTQCLLQNLTTKAAMVNKPANAASNRAEVCRPLTSAYWSNSHLTECNPSTQ